jgi:hypothetical protein
MSDREPERDERDAEALETDALDPEAPSDQLLPVLDDPELPDADAQEQLMEVELDDDYDR